MNLHITPEPDTLTHVEFTKARLEHNWAVFRKSDIEGFVLDISTHEYDAESIAKAKKDISQLVQKIIVDSIGRKKVVWVKPMDTIKRSDKKGDDAIHTEAIDRHTHNTKTQRMGRESSLLQIERHYGRDIADKIRNSVTNTKAEPLPDNKKMDVQGNQVEYITAGRNKILVHPEALTVIKLAVGSADSHKDIETAKAGYVGHATAVDKFSNKQAVMAFHKYLKTGINEQTILSGEKDGSYFTSDMKNSIIEGNKKGANGSDKKIEKMDDVDEAIAEYVRGMVVKIERGGQTVDNKWKEGLANNFYMLQEHIDDKQYGYLKDFLSVKNEEFRSFFQSYTGIKLPPSDKETNAFLFKYTGE